jgi:hypothetical protein
MTTLVGSVPTWCITNQRRRSMLLDLHRIGAGASHGRGEGERPCMSEAPYMALEQVRSLVTRV